MKSLATITHEQAKLLYEIEANGGELTEAIEAAFAVNEKSLAEKVDNYVALLQRLDHEIDYFDNLCQQIADKARVYENLRDRLKNNVKQSMQSLGKKNLEGQYFGFTLASSTPKLVIHDESKIPNDFKIVETITKIDNAKLKAALKIKPIEGAALQETYSLRQGVAKKLAIE